MSAAIAKARDAWKAHAEHSERCMCAGDGGCPECRASRRKAERADREAAHATGNVVAQEEVVSALWEFAAALDAPIKDPESGSIRVQRLNSIGPTLARIMKAFGHTVTEIQ